MTERLHVICNSHLDPVWIWRRSSGRFAWLNTMHSGVRMMSRHSELKFSCSSAAQYRWIEETDQTLFENIRSLVREGRWEIVGGWEVQSDAIIAGTESLIRQALNAKEYFQDRFGVDVKIGYCVDSFGHSAELPKILAATGFTHYVFLRPMDQQMGQGVPPLPLLFDWKSADGSTVRALRILDSYNVENVSREDYLRRVDNHFANGLREQTLFFGVGDHGGGLSERHLEWLAEASRNRDVVFSTLGEYFAATANDSVPTLTNHELGPVFRGCYSACHEVKSKIAEAVRNLQVAEMAGVSEDELRDGWTETLFHHFHDILPGTSIRDAFEGDVFPGLGGVIAQTRTKLDRMLCRRTATLDTNFMEQGGVYLWNPQNTPVMGLVSFPAFLDPNETRHNINALKDSKGNVYPLQALQPPTTFGPCAVPWGNLTAAIPLEANGEAALAYVSDEWFPKMLGFKAQHALANRLSFGMFADDSGTWGFTMNSYLQPLKTAEWRSLDEYCDGPVCSILRCVFKLNDSEIQADIYRYAGIDELQLRLRIDWKEPLATLKMAVDHRLQDFTFHTGTPGGSVVRMANDPTALCCSFSNGCMEQFQGVSGEVSMVEWCAALRSKGNGGVAVYSPDLHSCDHAFGQLRITLLRTTPYADHHPFPRNTQTGYMDMGLNFVDLWIAEDDALNAESIPVRARRRLHNVEYAEITAHDAGRGIALPTRPEVSFSSEKVTVEAMRLLKEGDTGEVHLLNHSSTEEKATLADGQVIVLPPKALKIEHLAVTK
ncbi:MAG: hypothetical protein MJ106_03170 [Lentisphaeria bacterium]|nr:hypothetical protein [Lentisphaeria bacterium]